MKLQKHKGNAILICDFSHASRDEGRKLLEGLLKRMEQEAEGSVRLLIDAEGSIYDATHATEWKRHLGLFNSRLKRGAVVGLSPLNRMAMAGVRMYAKLMGQDKATLQTRAFETRAEALDYLAEK